jgi:peptidyl-tRNA hydrolase, PTH1 family
LRIVLGLGNGGTEYRGTRHNVGFEVADVLAERTGAAFSSRGDLGRLALTATAEIAGKRIVLAKPRTLMNLSGRAAAALCRRFTAQPSDLLVVYDDADLALGRVRVRPEGGTGGHNGIRSLVEVLGTKAFPRVKLGVRGEGRDARDLADYVLDRFLPAERETVARMVVAGADAVEAVVTSGLAQAQRAFNGDLAG